MQAIILAAGMGKRLGLLTRDNTKCMVKVHGQTLIERMIDQLCRNGIKRIIMVIGYKGEKVRKLIGDKVNGIPILYIENNIYHKTNNIYSLYLAKDFLTEDETLLLESDLIFSDSILQKLIVNPFPNIAVVAKYHSWMDGTVVTLDDENNIISFIPKKAFCFEDKDSYFKTVNIYKFSTDFSSHKYIPFLEAYCKALGNNEYYEQVLHVISLLDDPELKGMPLEREDKWYEIDDEQDLRNAEVLFASKENAPELYGQRYGGYWRFPNLIDFCYLVNPYFPSMKMKEEMVSNFNTLLTEYPSGMGVNAQLAARFTNVHPEQMVVGNGAAELINAYLLDNNVPTGVVFPTFEEYPNRLSPENIISYVPDNADFAYTADNLIEYFDKSTIKQLLFINPDNPSGNILSTKEVMKLIEWSKEKDIRLLVDESFLDFAKPDTCISLFQEDILEENSQLLVMKSISKSYGVPGLRLGFFASGDRKLIKTMKKSVSIWNINSFAEFFMQIFPKYQYSYEKACIDFIEERDRFQTMLEKVPFLRVIPSAANYFLCEVTGNISSGELSSKLLTYDILIKDCSKKLGFQNKQYIRLAIRNENDNNRLIEVLSKLTI